MSEANILDSEPEKYSRGCGLVFFALMIIAGAVWGGALGAFVWVLDESESTIEALEEFRPKIGSKVYSSDGVLLGEFTRESRQLVPLSEIPLHVQKAFVGTEDHVFYQHKGVRPDAILNSAIYIARTGNIRGGSTITQQVVRNVEATGISKEVSLNRKIKEAIVALQLERQYTKDEILELYLNMLFLGVSAHGVEAASQQYFNKSCREMTLGEAAMLAGLARSPNRNEPLRNFENALARRNIVLDQLLEEEFISEEEYAEAITEDLAESVVTAEERRALREQGESVHLKNEGLAPYFFEEVRQLLLEQVPEITEEELYGGGLEIYTTINMEMQRAAEEALLTRLDTFDEEKLEYLTNRDQANEFSPVSGALVSLDNRPGMEGYVRAMVGGRDFKENQYNTVTQAYRQPGSSVKPFVWSAAIHNGYTAADMILDEPFRYVDAAGNVWQPKNFDGKYNGPITLRRALEKSVNIVSIKLVQALGMPLVRSYIQRSGVSKPIDRTAKLTIALGVHSATPMEQAVAYSIFAHNGDLWKPTYVTEVRDRDGFVRYRANHESKRVEKVLPENVAYVMNYLLQGVATYGTGARSAALERPRAGKTGTTNNSRDVWFCGFTPQFTSVVWMGYRDNRPLGRGINYTGGRLACPVWTQYMIEAHQGLPILNFEKPDSGISWYNIDRETGLAGGSFPEVFLAGTRPPEEMPIFYEGDIDSLEMQLLESF